MFRHHDESMQAVTAFAAIPIKSFQKKPYIDFDCEQFSAVERREGHEIGSGWRDESSGLQGETSAAGSRTSSSDSKLARVELVPFPVVFLARVFVLGKVQLQLADVSLSPLRPGKYDAAK